MRGRPGLDELWRTHPETVEYIRKALVNASAWSFIRGVARFFRDPWLLAILSDMRRPWEVRLDEAIRFMSKKLCCLDKGFGRRIRRRVGDYTSIEGMLGDGILSMLMLELLWHWARSVSGTTQDIELRHGRHRNITCPQSKVVFLGKRRQHGDRVEQACAGPSGTPLGIAAACA